MQLLTVHAGDSMWGIPLEEVLEIFDSLSVTQLPLLPPEFAGVLDVRGVPVPIADVAQLSGAAPLSGRRTAVLLRNPGAPLALLVGTVDTVISVEGLAPVENEPPWVAGVTNEIRVIDAARIRSRS